MKNLFLLPSDSYKNAKLSLFQNKLYLGDVASTALPQNIYIISDEEIKDGYVFNSFNNTVYRIVPDNSSREILSEPTNIPLCVVNKEHYFKIILTTDPDLIKDGVQPIPDDFLNWFINNPTCEEVEVKKSWFGTAASLDGTYVIITPQEKLSTKLHIGEVVDESYPKAFRKQETLEEAAKQNALSELEKYKPTKERFKLSCKNSFLRGAKWQQEISYSEEDIRNAIDYGAELGLSDDIGNSFEWKRKKDLWFEQFKKK